MDERTEIANYKLWERPIYVFRETEENVTTYFLQFEDQSNAVRRGIFEELHRVAKERSNLINVSRQPQQHNTDVCTIFITPRNEKRPLTDVEVTTFFKRAIEGLNKISMPHFHAAEILSPMARHATTQTRRGQFIEEVTSIVRRYNELQGVNIPADRQEDYYQGLISLIVNKMELTFGKGVKNNTEEKSGRS